jgi:RNA recognition motif-containing protein
MNLYVSNISFSLTEKELEQAFADFGTVNSVKIITDKFTGKSRGFGFVEMENDAEAKAAMKDLNGTELGGRELQVKEALPKKENNNKGGGNYSNKNDFYSKGNKRY